MLADKFEGPNKARNSDVPTKERRECARTAKALRTYVDGSKPVPPTPEERRAAEFTIIDMMQRIPTRPLEPA